MTKAISLFLILSFLLCLFGCGSNDAPTEYTSETVISENSESDAPTTAKIDTESEDYSSDTEPPAETTLNKEDTFPEDDEPYYAVCTDWMTFYFSKNDFKEEDIQNITAEAVRIMTDVRNYLNVSYTVEDAAESVCYFDSAYRNSKGQKRSMCFWDERKMYCLSLASFVHEYTHMVSESNTELLYHPSAVFSEGLAEYVSLNFFDGIATDQYSYFKSEDFTKISNPTEHQAILDLLSDKGLEYNEKNYNKSVVALACKVVDVSSIDKSTDFYKYYVGYVFVDYCINKLGGVEKFISAYSDSITVADMYEKTLDELISEACASNTNMFYAE